MVSSILLTQGGHWSWLKAWGMRVAQRQCQRCAIVVVARRLAVILHRMWTDGTDFRWGSEPRRSGRLITHYSSFKRFCLGRKEVLTGTKVE